MRLPATLARRLPPAALAGALLVALAVSTVPDAHAAGVGAPELVHQATAHDALFDIEAAGTRVLAVGSHGSILLSTDGGQGWAAVRSGTGAALLGVALTAAGRGIIVGQYGTVLYSADGGASWTPASPPVSERLFAVTLDRRGAALAVGAFGTLLHSSDHGQRWTSVSPDWGALLEHGEAPHLYAVLPTAGGTVLVAGEFGTVLEGRPGRGEWRVLASGEASLFALAAGPDGTLWAAGQAGTLLRSTDAGRRWSALDSAASDELLDVHPVDSGAAVLIGRRALYAYRDGPAHGHGSGARVAGSEERIATLALPWQQAGARLSDGTLLLVGGAGGIVRLRAVAQAAARHASSAGP